MAITTLKDILNATGPQATVPIEVPAEEVETPSFKEGVQAAIVTDSPIYQTAVDFAVPVDKTVDPNFNIVDHMEAKGQMDLLRIYPEDFAQVFNAQHADRVIFDINYRHEQLAPLAQMSAPKAISSFMVGSIASDPLTWIPLYGTLKKLHRGARAVEAAKTASGLTLGSSTLREMALTQQEGRTTQEALLNVFGETAFAATFGGALGGISGGGRTLAKQALANSLERVKDVSYTKNPKTGLPELSEDSAGAMKAQYNLDDNEVALINKQIGSIIAGPKFLQSPSWRGLNNMYPLVQGITDNFFSHNLVLKKHLEGKTSSYKADARINADLAAFDRNIANKIDDLFLQQANVGRTKAALGKVQEGTLTRPEFNRRVAFRLADNALDDAVEEVNKAAAVYRKLLDEKFDQLVEIGRLNKEQYRSNYFTQRYRRAELEKPSMQTRFLNDIGRWLEEHNPDGTLRAEKIDADQAENQARQFLDRILREDDNTLELDAYVEQFIGEPGFLKQRQLNAPFELLSPFIDLNMDHIIRNYAYKVSGMFHTKKALEALGFENLADAKKQLVTDKDAAVAALQRQGLKGDKLDAASKRIIDEFQEGEKLLDLMFRSLTNTIRKPDQFDKVFHALKTLQYTRLLGGVTLASLPEPFTIAMKAGIKPFHKDYIKPMLKDMKALKASTDELNDFDVGLNGMMNDFVRVQLGASGDLGSGVSKFERSVNAAAAIESTVSGINWWTDAWRRLAGQVYSAKILRYIDQWQSTGKLTQKQTRELASIGIGKDDYALIAKELKTVDKIEDSYISNLQMWTNKAAREKFGLAVQQGVNGTILRPGKGDIPFIVQQSRVAQIMFQFKSFMSAATGRISIAGLQQRDASVLMGVIGMTAMGALSGAIKDIVANRDPDTELGSLVADGLARSGLLGLVGNTLFDVGLSIANEKTRRFGGNLSTVALGPSAGYLQDISKVIGSPSVKNTLRLLPFANLFYIQALTSRVFGKKK